MRDLRAAIHRLNPDLLRDVREQAIEKLTRVDSSRSLLHHNRERYDFIRDGASGPGITISPSCRSLGGGADLGDR
ncbi:MAG: hypothetical protein ABR961_16075 [Thermoanaerobaculaceae bacterium]